MPTALKASRIAPAPKLSTRLGGARSTKARSTSAITSSSRLNAVQPVRIAGAQFCEGLLRAPFAGEQIAAIGGGQEILRAAFDDFQAVLMQFQIGNDLRVEQADGIGRDRIAETGMEFLRHRRAARHLAALDHPHAQAPHREVSRAGEAVMPGADDDNVRLCHGRFKKV